MRPQFKDERPHSKNTEISKLLGERWSNMNESQKAPYVEKAKEDTERYRSEMQKWQAGNY